MLKHVGLILLTYTALVLQSGASEMLMVGSIGPMFLPLVLLVVIFCVEGFSALLWGAVLGLLDDCMTPDRIGVGVICWTLAVYLVQCRLRARPADSLLSVGLCFFYSCFGLVFATTVLRAMTGGAGTAVIPLVTGVAGTALYTTAIGLLLFVFSFIVKQILLRLFPSSLSRGSSRWHMLTE